jgi:hypothetical protein
MPIPFAVLAAVTTLSLYTGPEPEKTALYRDWITGCDNVRNCAAVALAPADSSEVADHLEILIEQPLGYQFEPVVTIKVATLPAGGAVKLALTIDAAPVVLPPPERERLVFRGPLARPLLQALRGGNNAVLRDAASGKQLARASLAGLTAALLRIDAQQGKAGTPRALVRTGNQRFVDDLPGFSVTLTRPPRGDRPPTQPDAGQLAKLSAGETCVGESKDPAEPPRLIRLDRDNSMVILPVRCGSGAYNLYANVMIVDGFGEMKPAKFDYDVGITGDGPGNVVVNVGWDDSARVLESHILHRAIGDCGKVDRFIWDGEQFRLSEQRVMPECRSSFDRIPVWKVGVIEQ